MPKELRELLNKINEKKTEAKNLLGEKKLDEAQALTNEIKDMQKEFDIASALYEEEKEMVKQVENKGGDIDSVKAFYKALRGESLTEAENAMLTGGANGEDLIVPKDIQTQINELRRQYKSARSVVGYYPTSTLTGSFVYEDASTVTELSNFTDGADIGESNEPKFVNVSYSIKDYGATLPISNRLLQNEDGGLVPYLGQWFNRKAIRTENGKIFAQLKSGKTAKALADWKALKKSLNVDLDPAFVDVKIVTNQDGFDVLDAAEDNQGRPILQPNPVNPTQKMFNGHPIEVFSNTELPTTGTTTKKAPIFYGSTQDGITFVDRNQLKIDASEHAAFKKNQTLMRVIEQFDVIDADKASYVFGELTVV
ncbi:phage major capsid protein [Rossellomorea sp. DA94]|uniref:phage major capsid protein n=1 Tax=Rossellomorea sp. DA94 TaxID=3038653 RepID=UPI002447B39F|nr:phage major capsid protein [Rossellomorea sp. DA94]WGG47681.1 phage major capsid protein [Rossellomorea sp. DA94]